MKLRVSSGGKVIVTVAARALAQQYEKNLVHLIKRLRMDFAAPNAKFVCATLGQTQKGATDNGGKILDAMFAVDGNSGKYPGFQRQCCNRLYPSIKCRW